MANHRGLLKARKRGQTMTEYALILAAIAVAALGLYRTLGTQTNSFVQTVVNLF
jgi:Flp pilus assembly pilin Flp